MKNESKTDFWVLRDDQGVLHDGKVVRKFDGDGQLTHITVSTACMRQGNLQVAIGRWSKTDLPPVTTAGNRWGKDRIMIVEYRVRETPTCVRCVGSPKVF